MLAEKSDGLCTEEIGNYVRTILLERVTNVDQYLGRVALCI